MDISKIDEEALMEALESDDNSGFCTECGEQQFGCEPDAQGYKCENCGKHAVYGAPELIYDFI